MEHSMRVLPVVLPASLGLAFGFAATPAAAYVDIEDARLMAFDHGIVKLEEVELDDGVWEIEGEDASGHEIDMEIDARTGRIIKMERD
jgi:hypothetical protein